MLELGPDKPKDEHRIRTSLILPLDRTMNPPTRGSGKACYRALSAFKKGGGWLIDRPGQWLWEKPRVASMFPVLDSFSPLRGLALAVHAIDSRAGDLRSRANAAVYVLGRLRLVAPATEANLYASYCMNQP